MIPRILYLSFNDGSDMRINKELRTLSQAAQVDLVALGPDPALCYAKPLVHTLYFVQGSRKAIGTLIRYFLTCVRLLFTTRYHSVHLINEPQLLILWPFLWLQRKVVLDIFDSIFLRKNRPGNQWSLLKRVIYAPIDEVLVTDGNRLNLLPDFLKSLSRIVPNFPYQLKNPPIKERAPYLTIMYYGWLGELRGTETVRNLLRADPNLRVLMAGWLADEPSRELTKHKRVEWLGVLPQDKSLQIVARRADYLLCVYAPINDNNINASPNKIYDAIQTHTPVIMNAEVKVSEFVKEHRIGYIVPQYNRYNYSQVARDLYEERASYQFDEILTSSYIWENVEGELRKAHGI